MTICSCIFPVWMYDSKGKEYYALPVEIALEKGYEISEKKYGDIIVDLERDGSLIPFVAMPFWSLKERGIEIPEMEMIDYEVLVPGSSNSSIVKQFMRLKWQEITDEQVKKYDVRGHIFVAGCKPSEMVKEIDLDPLTGKEKEVLHCSEKGIFTVLHPIDEFLELHIGELKNEELNR